jgi:putative PIN family toxin of toxin-antitoxin system
VRRITLDANVLAPGVTSQGGASVQILKAWHAGAFELVLSDHLLQEVARALTDPYFAARLAPGEVAAFVARLRTVATVTELTIPVRGVATHSEDDLVLSTVLSGDASILCTRDKQLLKLRSHQSVSILSPGELLALLESEGLA